MIYQDYLTESLCPICLLKIEAFYQKREEDIILYKTCPQHGVFETVVWRGEPNFESWQVEKIHTHPKVPFTEIFKGCPYDCGPCADHLQQPCCVLLEVTQRCNLECPLCFASSRKNSQTDPPLGKITQWFKRLQDTQTNLNIQLSGGEPTVRDDLDEIIRIGREAGFTYFQLNTNGLRLASDPNYLERLVQAGLSCVYLQFDGVSDSVYQFMRGRSLFSIKEQAVRNCINAGVGLVLVPTIIPGVNDGEIGDIFRFALRYHPGVRGIHFQPVSYFGRFPHPPRDQDRITLPEIIHLLVKQSGGAVKQEHFKAATAEHARCTFSGNFVVMPDGELKSLTRFKPAGCGCQAVSAEQARMRGQSFVARTWSVQPAVEQPKQPVSGFAAWDGFLSRTKTHSFAISGMAFQDAWTIDLARLKQCKIFIYAPDGRLIPFCAYNLTSQDGETLYRGRC